MWNKHTLVVVYIQVNLLGSCVMRIDRSSLFIASLCTNYSLRSMLFIDVKTTKLTKTINTKRYTPKKPLRKGQDDKHFNVYIIAGFASGQ